eukprot:EG_transcript_12884
MAPSRASDTSGQTAAVARLWSVVDAHAAEVDALAATADHPHDRFLGPFLLKMADTVVCWPSNVTLGLAATYWELHRRFRAWAGCPDRPAAALPDLPDGFHHLAPYMTAAAQGPVSHQLKVLISDRGPLLEAFLHRAGHPQCFLTLLARAMEQVVGWAVPTVPALRPPPAVVVAFSLGTGRHVGPGPRSFAPGRIHPGHSNEGLAHTILNLLRAQPSLELYVQWEIGDLLTGFSYNAATPFALHYDPLAISATDGFKATLADLTGGNASRVHKVYPKPGTYLSTAGVVADFGAFLLSAPHVKTVYVVGHPDHRKRCRVEVLSALARFKKQLPALEVVFPPDQYYPDWRQHGCDPHGYDHNSTQPWTRSRGAFIPTEMRHRLGWIPYKDLHCGPLG